MKRIDLDWTWMVESPLHCGSGLSEPGVADRRVQLDSQGNPFVPGDAIKGALRMGAEQVVAWLLGTPFRYPDNAEPTAEPLARIFGGGAEAHFQPASVSGTKGTDWRLRQVSSTAIDARTGVALGNTLRVIEVIQGKGLALQSKVSVWVDGSPEGAVDRTVTMLLASLAAVENLGAKAGIGWGVVTLDPKATCLRIDGVQEPDPTRFVDEGHLTALKGALEVSRQRPSQPSARPTAAAATIPAPLVWKKVRVVLKEPTCLPEGFDVSNRITTARHVPASALRGAFRGAWIRSAINPGQAAAALSPAVRWSPAVPEAGDGVAAVPVPLSFACAKGEKGLGTDSVHGVHDALSGTRPPERDEDGGVIQWRPMGRGWMDPGATRTVAVPTRVSMHVARHYVTGSKREGALFTRESIDPGTEGAAFVAWVQQVDGVQLPSEVFLGKRRSAGNGRAEVQVQDQDPFAKDPKSNADPCDVFVQLLSPALVRGPEGGHFLRSLRPSDWARLAGVDPSRIKSLGCVEGSAARTAAVGTGGWMEPWGHSRASVDAVCAGSVWRLRCLDASAASELRAKLADLARRGLGERTHEGFGWFVVDPPWLGHKKGVTAKSAVEPNPPKSTTNVRSWPGCDGVPVAELEAILDAAREAVKKIPNDIDPLGPFHEMALQARQKPAADVFDFAGKMAARTNQKGEDRSHAWRFLKEGTPCRQFLQGVAAGAGNPADKAARFRFAIEALTILAKGERR